MARPTGDKSTEEQRDKILEDALKETFEGGAVERERVVHGGGSREAAARSAEYERRRAIIAENVARAREAEARREVKARDEEMGGAIFRNDCRSMRELLSKYGPGELTNRIIEDAETTFLALAAVPGKLESVNFLINEAGVDIYKRDAEGFSALDLVIREKMVHEKRLNSPLTEMRGFAYSANNFPEIIKVLTPYTLTSESSPEQKYYYGIALIVASANNDAKTVEMLCEKGADVNYHNPAGADYPLDVAIINKAKDAFKVLRDSGKLVISEADRSRVSEAFGPGAVVASAAGGRVGGDKKEYSSLGGGSGGGGGGGRS